MARLNSPRLNVVERLCRAIAPKMARQLGEFERQQVRPEKIDAALQGMQGSLMRDINEALETAYPNDSFGTVTPEGRSWLIHTSGGLENLRHARADIYLTFALFNNGEAVEAACYNPITDDLTLVQQGSGAYSLSLRLRVGGQTDIEKAMIAVQPAAGEPALSQAIQQLIATGSKLRISGAPGLEISHLGAGRADIFIGAGLDPADVALASLLMRECGGVASDIQGQPITPESTSLVAGSSRLHGALLKQVAACKRSLKAS